MVVRDCFDDVLCIIKHAIDGDVKNIFVLQTIHLRGLKRAHFTFGREHEYIYTLLATHRVFGSTARVARSCAEDIERLTTFVQHIFKQTTQQLHRHVLECQGRTIRQAQ